MGPASLIIGKFQLSTPQTVVDLQDGVEVKGQEFDSILATLQNKNCMKIKSLWALSCGAWEAAGCFRTSLSQPLAARQTHWSARRTQTTYLSWEACAHKLLLTLWVKSGRVVSLESVVGRNNKVSPPSRESWPMAVSACLWVRSIPVIDQGGQEKVQICSVLHCGSDLSVLSLVSVKNK